jgi:predicted secreted protein
MNKSMNHIANASDNGSTIKVSLGDTLTVSLPYETTVPRQTAWTFGDSFGFCQCLNMGTIGAKDGVRTMQFVASAIGTVDIELRQFRVLALRTASNITGSYKLTVTVSAS